MRFNLLLITLLIIPCVIKAQSDVVFYSKGKMYVGQGIVSGSPSKSNTSLYVSGSMKFGSVDTSTDPDKKVGVVQEGRTSLTGDLINALDPDHGANNLFSGNGEISFANTIDGGLLNFNDASQPNIQLKETQWIKSVYEFGTADDSKLRLQKSINYLSIPYVHVGSVAGASYTSNYLSIDPTASVEIKELDVRPGAFFEVNARKDPGTLYKNYLNVGYVLLGKRSLTNSTDSYFQGNYVARLRMYDDIVNKTDNKYEDGTFHLTGFTPPFPELRADYMFFNTLTEPGNGSLTSWHGVTVDPRFRMLGGTGYFFAMDVYNGDYDEIENNWFGGVNNIDRERRAKGEYVFNRTLLMANKPTFNKSGVANPYKDDKEVLFDEDASVTVTLKEGFNFLGNPFMAPIDLGRIVNVKPSGEEYVTPNPDGTFALDPAAGFGNLTVSKDKSTLGHIRDKYWTVNTGRISYNTSSGWYEFKVSYYDAQRDGGTHTGGITGNDENAYHVAPMQMFVLQGSQNCGSDIPNGNCTFTIPAKARTLNSKALMTRSARADVPQEYREDELLLQIVNLEDNSEDRLSVVLRSDALLMDDDGIDTHKALNKAQISGDDAVTNRPMSGLIYTKSSNERPMLTNAVPSNTKQLAMYITPPSEKEENMVIRPYRLATMHVAPRVWLEDKLEKKIVELTETTEYYFKSPVLTNKEAAKNRFVLHFAPVSNDDIIGKETQINCYYNSSTLYISGLNEGDINSTMQVYDLQGRLITRATFSGNDVPRAEYLKPLPQGTYVVKITGKRNYTTKFVNLQN